MGTFSWSLMLRFELALNVEVALNSCIAKEIISRFIRWKRMRLCEGVSGEKGTDNNNCMQRKSDEYNCSKRYFLRWCFHDGGRDGGV